MTACIVIIALILFYNILILKDKVESLSRDLNCSDFILSSLISDVEVKDEDDMGYAWRTDSGHIVWSKFQPKGTTCLRITKQKYKEVFHKGEKDV